MKKYEEKKSITSPTSQLPCPQILSKPIEGFDEIIVKRLPNYNYEKKELPVNSTNHKKGELI